MPITPKTGSLFHAETQLENVSRLSQTPKPGRAEAIPLEADAWPVLSLFGRGAPARSQMCQRTVPSKWKVPFGVDALSARGQETITCTSVASRVGQIEHEPISAGRCCPETTLYTEIQSVLN